jgi:Leucine-rich repeat (LRR) protein
MTSLSAIKFSTCFPNLVTLNATSCGLQNMDELFQNDTLPNLRELDVSKNAFTSLKESDLNGFVNLRKINLSHNRINFVAWRIFGKLKNLKTVNLRSNKLTNLVLDANIGALCCPGITVLRLNNNQLTDVGNLKYFSGLKTLNLSDTSGLIMNTVPFEQLTNLTGISLSNNSLTNQADLAFLATAKNLQFLSIANNNFGTLNLAKFPRLTELLNINLLGLTIAEHLTLKNRFPKLKIVKMSSENWTCEFLQEVEEYLQIEHIQWMDKAVDTKQCTKMYGLKLLLILAGVCAALAVVVFDIAWVMYRTNVAINNDVPDRYNEKALHGL